MCRTEIGIQDTGYRIQDAGYMIKKKFQSYEDLEIYKIAKELAVEVHKMTLEKLPKFEMYEQGSQIRRSSKSVLSNIIEGYGRRRYKNEFIQFLTYAIASCDETKGHLELLRETGSLQGKGFDSIHRRYEELGSKLYNFREAVVRKHKIYKEET